MVNRIIDPPLAVYLLFALAAIILFAAWRRTRKRVLLVALAIDISLALTVAVLDYEFESPREQVVRKTAEAGRDIEAKNLDAFFRQVSERFHYSRSGKKEFRTVLEGFRNSGQLTSIKVWNIQVVRYPGQDGAPEDEMVVQFYFKVTGSYAGSGASEGQFTCKATFVRDPDGEWRLKGFEIFPPLGGQGSEIMVPGM